MERKKVDRNQHLRDLGFTVVKGTKGSKVIGGPHAERLADKLRKERDTKPPDDKPVG